MSKFMVIGNHRNSVEYHGVYDSQTVAVETVNLSRNFDRDPEHPLEWMLVTSKENEFGIRLYLSAWDATCTTKWMIVEINEPKQSLGEMFNESFQGFIDRRDKEPKTGNIYQMRGLDGEVRPQPTPQQVESRQAWAAYDQICVECEED